MTSVNLSVWDYYKPDFIDPLYEQYVGRGNNAMFVPKNNQQVLTSIPNRECSVKKLENNELVREELVPQGWGKRFQKARSYYPCPVGWISDQDGYCVEAEREFVPVFYTDKYLKQLPKRVGPQGQFYSSTPTIEHNTQLSKYWNKPNLSTPVCNIYGGKTRVSRGYASLPSKDSFI